MKPVRNLHHELPEYYLDRAHWIESLQREARPLEDQSDALIAGLLVIIVLCCGILAIVSRGAGWWG